MAYGVPSAVGAVSELGAHHGLLVDEEGNPSRDARAATNDQTYDTD